MPDDNQSPVNPTTTDSTSPVLNPGSDDTNAAADVDSATDASLDDVKIPSLDDLEYATPSAYIDPDLPATPTSIEEPNEPEESSESEIETMEMTPEQIAEAIKASNEVMSSVAEKIANCRNILIALSSDPSVDELAGAIALSLFLDRIDKHAIAIYSGATPNALEFLRPDETFEKSTDVLQDFVIALNKEKADHLRYKLDGDFVKIFITPYKDRIVSEDLDFSYGDYNVDLVLALNVSNGVDLDAALREYGRIMHDATVINITTGNPGKFGEIEWSNKFASSVSEMISDLLLSIEGDTKINTEEATALLTGIVAATDRFARANTFPGTMQIASRLMDAGADQQLVAANISDDVDNQFFSFSDSKKSSESDEAPAGDVEISLESSKETTGDVSEDDGTSLQISHREEEDDDSLESASTEEKSDDSVESIESEPEPAVLEPTLDSKSESTAPEPTNPTTSGSTNLSTENSALLDELKATETSLSNVGAETIAAEAPTAETPSVVPVTTEAVITPPADNQASTTNKYSQMLEDAINSSATPSLAPMDNSLPPASNPAASSAPKVADSLETSSIPEINYGQSPDEQLLPPPPAPPIDMNAPMPMPAPTDLPPASGSVVTPGVNPASAAAPDASAFTIPGV